VRRYWKLKEEALYCTLRRTRFLVLEEAVDLMSDRLRDVAAAHDDEEEHIPFQLEVLAKLAAFISLFSGSL
jgi:hypothetical protein